MQSRVDDFGLTILTAMGGNPKDSVQPGPDQSVCIDGLIHPVVIGLDWTRERQCREWPPACEPAAHGFAGVAEWCWACLLRCKRIAIIVYRVPVGLTGENFEQYSDVGTLLFDGSRVRECP